MEKAKLPDSWNWLPQFECEDIPADAEFVGRVSIVDGPVMKFDLWSLSEKDKYATVFVSWAGKNTMFKPFDRVSGKNELDHDVKQAIVQAARDYKEPKYD